MGALCRATPPTEDWGHWQKKALAPQEYCCKNVAAWGHGVFLELGGERRVQTYDLWFWGRIRVLQVVPEALILLWIWPNIFPCLWHGSGGTFLPPSGVLKTKTWKTVKHTLVTGSSFGPHFCTGCFARHSGCKIRAVKVPHCLCSRIIIRVWKNASK